MSKSKLSNLFKGRSVPNLPSYSSPWGKNDEKLWNGVKQQNIKQVKTILSKTSVTPTKLGPQGKSAFHLACELGNDLIVDAILASAQDVNDTTIQGVTALQLAAAKGHTSTVNKLLKKQANVDQRDCNGMTALHHACFGQHKDCVKSLLIKNADINAVEQGGKTPLFYSAHLGHFDICRWLLQRGADVDCQDKDNVTSLMLAAKEGHRDVCELLLKSGANPDLTDRYDKTALEYAVVSKHLELLEVFSKQYKNELHAHRSSVSLSCSGSPQSVERARPMDDDPFRARPQTNRAVPMDVVSIHSMDDCLLPNHQLPPIPVRRNVPPRNEQADETSPKSVYMEQASETAVKSAYRQEDDYTVVKSVYGSETHGTVPKSVYGSETHGTVPKSVYGSENHGTVPKSVYWKEGADLQEQFEKQDFMVQEHLTQKQPVQKQVSKTVVASVHMQEEGDTIVKSVYGSETNESEPKSVYWKQFEEADDEIKIADIMLKKDIKETKPENDARDLNQLIASLKKENKHLQSAMLSNHNVSADNLEILSERLNYSQLKVEKLLLEKEQLEKQITELREQKEHELQEAVDQDEAMHQNEEMSKEVETLRRTVESLQEELNATKNEGPTDAQRLDAILAASANFEEVNFDEEGFVEGRDMTKEEFLQAQNQELKMQCGRLTVELEKLRLTLDAILKAGDNLQSDYDHLATEKDALQDELETTLKEKREVITENEFLLADNNELHENLKKIVHELEKMQEKFKATHAENEELMRSVNVAGKVGEVARLLEERTALQQKCADLETTSQRLQHDHDILLEEVQSLNESLNQLTGHRNQLAADLEEFEPICQQHEALQVEYNQLEMEFAELLRDKEALEQQFSNNNEDKEENAALKLTDPSALERTLKQLAAEKKQLEQEKQQLQQENQLLEQDKQELEDVVNGLSRHIVATEHLVKGLENNLEQVRAAPVSPNLEMNGVEDGESINSEGTQKDSEEVVNLKKQIAHLTLEVEEWEKKHADTVTTYRTHLLSAVQGHMDPDVKDALYHIIELRSMEQFC